MKPFASLSTRLRSQLRAFARDRGGTSAIEFAIVAPMLIAVALATLQAASAFLAKAYFESGAEAAARIVLTNQTPSLTAAQFQTAICNQLSVLFNCSQVIVELEPMPVGTNNLASLLPTFSSTGALLATPTMNVGATAASPGADMLLVVMYPWPVYGGPRGLNLANLGSGKMLITSTQIFRIEPL